jgi:phage-related protein
MPGNVQLATPSQVMPLSLCKSFQRTLQYQVRDNTYKNGESQRYAQTSNDRSTWTLTKRLTAAQMATLRSFFLQQQGMLLPFYFYDVFETTAFAYDVTGASPVGRHIVRFASNWSQSTGLGRGECTVSLIQIY